MLHPVPTRTLPAQTRPTAALPTAHPLRALPGNEPAHGLKLAAADASEPERRHEDNKDDEAAWLPSGNEAAAATDTVSGAGAETAGASSVTGGASTTGAAAEATAGASSAPAGSSLFAGLTANPELTVGAILGTVTLGAAMTGKSPYDGSAKSAPAPSPLASGAGQQHGSAADSPATGNRGIEETGSGTSAGSASNTASGSGTAASTGTGAGVGAAAGSSSGAGAASGSHASSDAGHVGAAGTEGSAANAGGSGAPGGAAGGAATSPGTGHGTDPAHTQSLNYGTDENKAIGAAIFNGADSQDTPEFIRITSIRGKNAGTVNGLMTLENGQEITVGQVISRADFERIFWNASKSDGSFSFVPVKDAQGTAIPNTVEQTVIIRTPESTTPGSTADTPAGESGNAGHDTTSQTGSSAGTATGSNAGTPSGMDGSSGTGAGSGTHAGTGATGSGSGSGSGSENSGTDTNETGGRPSGNDKDSSSPQNTETPSGTGETSHQGSGSDDGTTPGGDQSRTEGSNTQNKPGTNPGSVSDSNTVSGSSSDSTSGSSNNEQSPSQSTGDQDKGGQTTTQGQEGPVNNGQTPVQNQGSQSVGNEAPARNDDAQSSDGKTPAQTPGSQGSGSDTGNPATGTPGTGENTQTGGTPTGGENDGNGDASVTPTNPPASEPASPPAHQAANAPAPILPDYTPNQSVQQAIHANDKPVGASIFNGTNPEHAPSFVKITAIQDKDGADVTGVMTLGKGGTAITTDQVISKEQFDNVFLDALKAPGGSFKFIPVLDSEGTAMPGASEQTVSIGVDYLHHFPSQTFSKLFSEEAHLSHYKIFSIAENEDTNGTQDGMLKIDGNERTPLQKGDLIKPEDFDKLYWDYSSNNGGRFIFVGVDSTGRNITDSDGEQLVLEELAKTRDGQEPPEIQIAGDGEDEGDEEAGISAHSAPLRLESFAESASVFHGASHLSVNGHGTLDNLLEHQVIYGIL